MNEPPGARARVALSGLTVAEYVRDKEGQDVLLFVDNIFRLTQEQGGGGKRYIYGGRILRLTSLSSWGCRHAAVCRQVDGTSICARSEQRTCETRMSGGATGCRAREIAFARVMARTCWEGCVEPVCCEREFFCLNSFSFEVDGLCLM